MSSETKKYPYPFPIIPWTSKWLTISVLVVLAGIVKMGINYNTKGQPLDFGIDFTGGASYVYHFDKLPGATPTKAIATVRPKLEAGGIKNVGIQVFPQGNQVQIRTRTGSDGSDVSGASRKASEEAQKILGILQQGTSGKVELQQQELVGPVIGKYLRSQAITAILLGCVLIMFYVWIRYNIGGLGGGYLFGVCALISLVHDVLVMLCCYAFTGHDIDTTFIASVLTVVGFSVQDTVIIFDRIRENLRKLDPLQRRDIRHLEDVVELSLWQTMTRSVVTVGTAITPLLCLYLFGGVSVRHFAFAMFVGMASGGYSSIFNASPLLILFNRRSLAKRALTEPLPAARQQQRPRPTAASAAKPAAATAKPAAPKPAATVEAESGEAAGTGTKKKGGGGNKGKRRY
ncbi:MAG: protein translocase subunit SecF [Armatimonadetes bacterium]|nr:protein translocase subunit SecF [Armatimonadota bacterium]